MTDWITTAVAAAVPSVLCGLFMAWVNRHEVEEGIAAYEAARKKYIAFLNEQATEYLN